ncbi:MAG TPA: tetratricopeptide repeat protein [Planctomycetes bacterium]|nr:tetratricopeptide repeat protein [Planctomycetota bacterium]
MPTRSTDGQQNSQNKNTSYGDEQRRPRLATTWNCVAKSGQLGKAAALYDQVLDQDPQHPDALHLLGLVNANQGRMLPTRRATRIEQS